MKVKIGETTYDSATEPVMVILSDGDKANIAGMPKEASMYAVFPDGWGSSDEMRAWMGMPTTEGLPK